jgi:hypothetical protein
MHEASDAALHVRLVARVFELSTQLHHLIAFEHLFLGDFLVLGNLLLGKPKRIAESLLVLLPRNIRPRALEYREMQCYMAKSWVNTICPVARTSGLHEEGSSDVVVIILTD